MSHVIVQITFLFTIYSCFGGMFTYKNQENIHFFVMTASHLIFFRFNCIFGLLVIMIVQFDPQIPIISIGSLKYSSSYNQVLLSQCHPIFSVSSLRRTRVTNFLVKLIQNFCNNTWLRIFYGNVLNVFKFQ